MRKFFKEVKIVAALLKAVAKGNVYFAVTSRRKGINDDGLMQYLFATKREAKDYCDWLKYSNKTFEPLEVVKVLTTKKYEVANLNKIKN